MPGYNNVWEYGGVGVWESCFPHTPFLPYTHTSPLIDPIMTTDKFNEAVQYVHSIGEWRSMKLGLERFTEFCARLGNPQDKFRSVHVAGTNGKGSTVAMIASILHAAGYRVGSYYSPFVYDIRERFLLNGEMISEADFVRLVDRIRPVAEEMEGTEHGHPTEFELKTALAFLWFAENQVDFAVLEVGLGGRLDATNIINPLVSVITNVSMDHMEHLGDTIEQIAAEKAGIIKPRVPCVTAATGPALEVIRRTAEERNSTLWWVHEEDDSYSMSPVDTGSSFSVQRSAFSEGTKHEERSTKNESRVSARDLCVRGIFGRYADLHVGMRGAFQRINAALAIAAAEVLQDEGVDIPECAIRVGLETACLPGRLEVIRENPTVILDGAHNPDAAHKLAEAVHEWFEYEHLIIIMGMVKGHSIEDTVSILAPLANRFIATAPSGPRSAPASDVADAARKYCPNVTTIEPIPAAVQCALESAGEHDLILVTGSFYTIGEVPH